MVEPNPVWGIIELVVIVALMVAGIPISISLAVVGLGFVALYIGVPKAISMAGITAWTISTLYTFSMFPLFVLVGTIVSNAGMGKDVTDCFLKWLSKLKGGLAIVSTFSSAAFGAITGSSVSTVVSIGNVTMPEMKRLGYSAPLRTGSIANAGILANLIPPSTAAILYCIVTETSVARVLIAGLIPGIILTILYSVTIWVWARLKPNAAPLPKATYSFKEKVRSTWGVIPILILFFAVMGGIYTGLSSPTEAAGLAVIYSIVMAFVMKRLTKKNLLSSLRSAAVFSCFVMLIIIGATTVLYSLSLTRLPYALAEWLVGLNAPPTAIIFIICFLFIFFGCVMETIILLLLFVPLFFPAVIKLGFDPVWFGTVSVMAIELALVTPPMAILIYVTQAVDGEATTSDVIQGVIPFYLSGVILIILLIFFPQIALWLPNTMMQ